MLAGTFGFAPPVRLDAQARRDLGLGSAVARAAVASGNASLRALLLEVRAAASLQVEVAHLSARLGTHSPQLLWLVLGTQPAGHGLVLAAPAPGARPRVFALDVDRRRVVDSDAETVAAIQDASSGVDLLVHQRWRELLGREALTRRFYRELERVVVELAVSARGTIDQAARREIALLHASRLLFLAFLEAKGWLNGDREFLRHAFDDRCNAGGEVHRRLLEPLFFGTLNTPHAHRATAARALGRVPFLNGGLFARTPLEKRHRQIRFSDHALGAMIGGLLSRFRVTARENSTEWNEAAVDPEMLGRAFESLMVSEERRASGAFYTPRAIIERVSDEGLEAALAARGAPAELVRSAGSDAKLPWRERARLQRALASVRILDPACGSGAFLVHLLERLSALTRKAGDERPTGTRRRDILARSIFGVDVTPTAVWMCQLRLWLSVVIDTSEHDPLAVKPLPNLDRHIRVGDALAGPAFSDAPSLATPAALARLRGRYAGATGVRKRSLARLLDREERRIAVEVAVRSCATLAARRRELLGAVRARDLFANRTVPAPAQRRELQLLRAASRHARRRAASLRDGAPLPFSFPVHFADVAAAGGFDLLAGNPPWVRLHHIPAAARESLRARYRTFRNAAWLSGTLESGAGRAFAAQVDLASLFVERSLELSRPGGVIALLLPAKLWRSLAGGGVRRVLCDDSTLGVIEDWSGSRATFDAVVYPSFLLTVRRARHDVQPEGQAPPHSIRVAVHRGDDIRAWDMSGAKLALDDTAGAPWLLVPPEVRSGFDRLAGAGPPLARTALGRPLLGVKSGCNEAFVLTAPPGWSSGHRGVWPVRSGAREGSVEAAMLRPLLRGESVRAWVPQASDDALLWTHDAIGMPRQRLPPSAAAWLAPWRRRLEQRTDGNAGSRWWSLFRTEAARNDRPRVVWSDISKVPRALVLPPGDPTIPLNSCYVVRAPSVHDALAFCALLNSAVAAAWLAIIAEPARGGYHRFMGWTLGRFPLPRDWPHAVGILAPLAQRAIEGSPPDEASLADAVIRAYRVRAADLSALLSWCHRSP